MQVIWSDYNVVVPFILLLTNSFSSMLVLNFSKICSIFVKHTQILHNAFEYCNKFFSHRKVDVFICRQKLYIVVGCLFLWKNILQKEISIL